MASDGRRSDGTEGRERLRGGTSGHWGNLNEVGHGRESGRHGLDSFIERLRSLNTSFLSRLGSVLVLA